ncbi:hypothetical protein Golob_027447 [Gossypium lobatum]|uniref:Uncharacterized protein n=1 Tax=Gossypium lobatum TaxID=34289 RepID=A0A7J8NI69_9ROSI|nr:hypothetical protein [Gossypium lobatum]
MDFLIKWRIMRLSKPSLRQHNTCFMPLPSFGILLTVVSLLGEVIWYLQ